MKFLVYICINKQQQKFIEILKDPEDAKQPSQGRIEKDHGGM